MSAKDEVRVVADEHPKMLKEFRGSYDGQALKAYVRYVGKSSRPYPSFQIFPGAVLPYKDLRQPIYPLELH